MLKHLDIVRPLVAIDTETTGLLPHGRIVELALVKVTPAGRITTWCQRLNPGVPIPPQASRVHRIYDHHVAGCRSFGEVAGEVLELLEGCDLAGFNLLGFDLEILDRELDRIDRWLDLEGVSLLDAMTIWHTHYSGYPRRLANAVRVLLDRDHDGAHGAGADAAAALEVLDAMVGRYELVVTPAELDCYPYYRTDVIASRGRLRELLERGRRVSTTQAGVEHVEPVQR